MGELMIRRNRGTAVPLYQRTDKTEKAEGGAKSQRTARATVTVSETLQRLMTRVSQAENHIRDSRRTLQAGEGVLAEVQDSLGRMAKLAQEAENGSAPDYTALQEELEKLRENIGRMIRSADVGGMPLFLDEDMGLEEGAEAMLYAVMGEALAQRSEEPPLPDWLLRGMANSFTPEEVLAALGLDKGASGAELLAALANRSLESDPVAGYLAALYLGAVIAGGSDNPGDALEGLQQLLEKVSEGMPVDQAVELLTNGEFESLAEFQNQVSAGTAPGLEEFLIHLLLADSGVPVLPGSSLLAILAGMEGANLELMMGLLSAAQSTPPSAETDGAAAAADTAGAVEAGEQTFTAQVGNVQAAGKDLSGVSFRESTGELVISGTQDVIVRRIGQGEQAILLTGSGRVTLQGVTVPVLTAVGVEARIAGAGESILGEVRLEEGATLSLEGGGLLKMGAVQGGESNLLRLTGGAAAMMEEPEGAAPAVTVPVVVEGPVSLAIHGVRVSDSSGKGLEPFDLVWKTLLPNWRHITSMEVDGRQTRMSLLNGDPARLWLAKGDASHGYPIHSLVIRGRDKAGQPQTRYAYLLWSHTAGRFEECSMYPNPFAVTGGEAGRDWIYEEESHTLRILSNQVTAIAGGSGTDANQLPFSGRIALADAIGGLELALGGVVCRVPAGRAFDLGRENDVTLVLQSGTDNLFESGAGCAGISMGEGTCLHIDCADRSGMPEGRLSATGRAGGAGIGRDSGAGRDRSCQIFIRSGVITASGSGGGAGIGAGKWGAMGPVTILGGTVTSTGGSGGGAGIGGALGAPVGDIHIQGGRITASAIYHAAAIGAGVQGECGEIRITGTARIIKAVGGDPGADIGACLFGGCGEVLISGGADIGSAQLRRGTGVALRMGEDTITLPQFRLSARALSLDRLSVSDRTRAREARKTLDADCRLVSRIQMAYGALYGRLEESSGALYSVQRYFGRGLVRDTGAANTLLEDMRQSICRQPAEAMKTHSKKGTEDVRQLLE